jgi:hypothetical protein
VYYRHDIHGLLAGKLVVSPASSIAPFPLPIDHDELFPLAQTLTGEISAYLEQAQYAKSGKPEILFGLQQIAKRYKEIKSTNYEPAINSLIVFESKDKCAVSLSEGEIRQVWLG